MILIVCLCVAAFLPITAYAQTYHLSDTDMSISVDDTIWYVFTRDNIENNAELGELGITYDAMADILYDNQAYMDAILIYDDGEYIELFVRKKALDSGVANLSNYKDEEVLELAEELAKKYGAENYSAYENPYIFAKLEYVDANYGYYICEFDTVVNKDNYTLTFQSTSQFTDWEYEEIHKIVDSVQFDVDPSIKEEKTSSFFDNVVGKTLGGAIAGGIGGAIVAMINQRKKKRKESQETE
jgi:hypothetical protein